LANGTLNVKTLAREDKKDLLVRKINRYKWDIIGLSEAHFPVARVEKNCKEFEKSKEITYLHNSILATASFHLRLKSTTKLQKKSQNSVSSF